MKNSIILIGVISSLFLMGCQDDFLERDPFGTIDENTFFTKKEHADYAALASYSKLLYQNGHWAQAQLELGMTGDFSAGGFKDAQRYYVGAFDPNDINVVQGIWKTAYSGIAVCNQNIEKVSQMPKEIIEAELKNTYLAEMRFIRAFWYFRLIQFYGDVPMITKAIVDPTDKSQVEVPVSSKSEIIEKLILPDLIFATENLPYREDWSENNQKRADKGAAFGYLMEVSMYTENWENAISAGQEIEKMDYSLMENPGNVYRVDFEDTKETIFSAAFGPGMESYREFYYGTIESLGELGRIMRGDTYSGDYFYPSNDFVDFFETIDGKKLTDNSPYFDNSIPWKNRDPRFDATFFTPMDTIVTTNGVQVTWDPKWLVNTVTGYDIQKRGVWYGENTWNKRTDIHFLRLPKIYLNMAEAYARLGNFGMSEIYIEKVRDRARRFALKNPERYIPGTMSPEEVLPKKTVNSLEEALEAINYESRVEFFTEYGIRYFDLKRWGKLSQEWSKVGDFTWDDKLFNLPIPNSELNNNSNIKQNHQNWGN